jgi:hypothetical protein
MDKQANDQDLLKDLEQLEVIESNELAVGNAFHAFRFNSAISFDNAQEEAPKN